MGVLGQHGDVLGEGLHQLQAALEAVPAVDLGDDPGTQRHRTTGQDRVVGQAAEGVGAPVVTHEGHRLEGRLAGEDPGQARHRPGLVQVQDPVLGGVGVDGGSQDSAALGLDIGRAVLGAGDDDEVHVLQVAVQEGPGVVGGLACALGPGVAAPDDRGARRLEGLGQARRGRVVQDDDVVGADLLDDVLRVGGQDVLVDVALLIPELAAVAVVPVDAGVQAGRDPGELLGGVQGQPAHVKAGAQGVAHEGGDRLRRPRAGGCRRRDRPHGAPLQQGLGPRQAGVQSFDGHLVQVALQVRQGQRGDVDVSHAMIFPRNPVRRSTLGVGVASCCRFGILLAGFRRAPIGLA